MDGIDIGEVALGAVGVIPLLAIMLGIFLATSWGIVRLFTGASSPDPRAILAERLARGEITPEAFDTAMRALGYGDG